MTECELCGAKPVKFMKGLPVKWACGTEEIHEMKVIHVAVSDECRGRSDEADA